MGELTKFATDPGGSHNFPCPLGEKYFSGHFVLSIDKISTQH